MEKIKLGISMEDEEYQARFVKCLMNHYRESYEVHIIHDFDEYLKKQTKGVDVLITEDCKEKCPNTSEESIFFVLEEGQVYPSEKYQEVYKIMDGLEKVLMERKSLSNKHNNSENIQLVGVFALEKEKFQIPFSALLAEILGETERVLVLDIQPFSGLSSEIEVEDVLGLEDLMSITVTENYTSSRLIGSIGHEQKWDFVYPVKNVSCLAEGSKELFEKMLQILQRERGYTQIIINFGTIFPEVINLMETCHQFYFLTERREERNWREEAFISEIKGIGKENFLQRIQWIEIPKELVKEKSWKQLVKRWLWSEFGDMVRELSWRKEKNGGYM